MHLQLHLLGHNYYITGWILPLSRFFFYSPISPFGARDLHVKWPRLNKEKSSWVRVLTIQLWLVPHVYRLCLSIYSSPKENLHSNQKAQCDQWQLIRAFRVKSSWLLTSVESIKAERGGCCCSAVSLKCCGFSSGKRWCNSSINVCGTELQFHLSTVTRTIVQNVFVLFQSNVWN